MIMREEEKSSYFKELVGFEAFQAQLSLEEESYNSYISKLLSLDTKNTDVGLEYIRIRGMIDALKALRAARENLVTQARTRNSDS